MRLLRKSRTFANELKCISLVKCGGLFRHVQNRHSSSVLCYIKLDKKFQSQHSNYDSGGIWRIQNSNSCNLSFDVRENVTSRSLPSRYKIVVAVAAAFLLGKIKASCREDVDEKNESCDFNENTDDAMCRSCKKFSTLDAKSNSQFVTSNSIEKTNNCLLRAIALKGITGLSVAVIADGKLVCAQGYGKSNIELNAYCYQDSVFRIASISKPLVATIAMKLFERGLLDLDKPIKDYLGDEWPDKFVNGELVNITTRHLLTHTSGIRHYHLARHRKQNKLNQKKFSPFQDEDDLTQPVDEKLLLTSEESSKLPEEDFLKLVQERRKILFPHIDHSVYEKENELEDELYSSKANLFENYITRHVKSIKHAVALFKNDELFFQPGKDFKYSSHGYVLLSRVLEVASGRSFKELVEELLSSLNLKSTALDEARKIVQGRVT